MGKRSLVIYTAENRKAVRWSSLFLTFQDLCKKIQQPIINDLTLEEFNKLPKAERDELKDVGGFVGGSLINGVRSKATVATRDLLTIDLDNIPSDIEFKSFIESKLSAGNPYSSSYCLYSTRNHTKEHQRYRLIVPFKRSVSPEEYIAIGRKYCEVLGILDMCDHTTFEPSRLMYWSSACIDQSPEISYNTELDELNPNLILNLYDDWTDFSQLPLATSEKENHVSLNKTQNITPENPTEKGGIIGAFCNLYNIHKAIAEYLPDIYIPVEGDPNRYTYAKGSTTGGAIVYDNGNFLYSNHATDPASGQLLNAFDLVRIHKFGTLDKKDTYKSKSQQPSYKAMMDMFNTDEQVLEARTKATKDKACSDISNKLISYTAYLTNEEEPSANEENANATKPKASNSIESQARSILQELSKDTSWLKGLATDSKGRLLRNLPNIVYVLKNCPYFKNRINYDSFSDVITAEAPFPWGSRCKSISTFEWNQFDFANLRVFLDELGLTASNDMVKTALEAVISVNEDALTHYIYSLRGKWDGIKRVDTYFIDTVGAEDSPYVREATRKQILGLVARAVKPGIKFDYMLILYGGQGIGKSTAVSRLARFTGQEPFRNWYVNMTGSMDSKEFTEKFLGHWVIELAELNSMAKSDIERIKDCITTLSDTYRKPYEIKPVKYYRRGVLFGTTNELEFLKDPSGNRRFNPIVCLGNGKISPFELSDDYIDQIYAEALTYFEQGESLMLSPEIAKESENVRKDFTIVDPWEDVIEDYVNMSVPVNWFKMLRDEQIRFMVRGAEDEEFKTLKLVKRTNIPYKEIWQRALGQEIKRMNNPDRKRIKNIMQKLGWVTLNSRSFRCGVWGISKCFVKFVKADTSKYLAEIK